MQLYEVVQSHQCVTQLAFSHATTATTDTTTGGGTRRKLVEHLWRYVLVQVVNQGGGGGAFSLAAMTEDDNVHAMCTWSICCDLFYQQLIAVRDDAFIKQHTAPQDYEQQQRQQMAMSATSTSTSTSEVVILAEHVILHLRNRLYKLYWGKPVLAQETKNTLFESSSSSSSQFQQQQGLTSRVAAARMRLFLVGTKLWNSLYERWSRLVRHSSFGDESTWLFPAITSLSFGDGIMRMEP
jgi:hypothetical protein